MPKTPHWNKDKQHAMKGTEPRSIRLSIRITPTTQALLANHIARWPAAKLSSADLVERALKNYLVPSSDPLPN